MNDTTYLLMWLEGPLQSWGFDSRFSRRDTLEFPTKSALLGMLCCALGAGGAQKEWLAKMAPLSTTVVAYSKRASSQLRDFHMIGAGYDDKDPFEKMMIPKTSEGEKVVGGGVKLTYRHYLQDAFFSAVLEIPKEESEAIAHALVSPVWDLFLGRKTCVPTDFIFRGIFKTEEEALLESCSIANEKSLSEIFRVVDGRCLDKPGEVMSLNDVPIEFGTKKMYAQRYVTIIRS